MRSGTRWTRRRFLSSLTAIGVPLVLPSGSAYAQGLGNPNERIVTGHIGLGPVGIKHLRALRGAAVAVCEVDEKRRYEGAAVAGPGVELYADYRRLLERNDIDAVVIATPDHWHATMAIDAIQSGKDIYIEAPACRTLGEGLRLARAGRYYGAVVQVGLGGAQVPDIAAALAQLEAGDYTEAEIHARDNRSGGDPTANSDAPEGLDWRAWLGPLRERAWNPDRYHGGDRWLLDCGGGRVRQDGASLFETALAAWQLNTPETVEVYAEGLPQREGLWDCPREMKVTAAFPGSGHVIRWSQSDSKHDGTMTLRGSGSDLEFEGVDESLVLKSHPETTGRSPSLDSWLGAMRTRTVDPVALDRAVLAASIGTLANLSYRLGRKLSWQPGAGQFLNDTVADRFVEELA